MTRETKIGMIVATSFLSLVGVVVGTKYYKKDIPGGDPTPGLQAFAQSGQSPFPTKVEPPAPAKQEPSATPKPGPLTPAVFTESSPLPPVAPPPAGFDGASIGTAGTIEFPKNTPAPQPPADNGDFKLPALPTIPNIGDAAKDATQSLQDKIREQERNAKNNIAAAKNSFFDNLNQSANDAKDQLKDKANGLNLPSIPAVPPPFMVAQETPKPAPGNKAELPTVPPLPAAPNFGGVTLPPVAPTTVKPTTDATPSLPAFGKPDSTPLPVFGQPPPPAASTLPPAASTSQQGFPAIPPPDRKIDVPSPGGPFAVPPPPSQGNGNTEIGKVPQIPGPTSPSIPPNSGFPNPPPPPNGFNDPVKTPGSNEARLIPQIPGPPNGSIPTVSVPTIPVVKTDTPTAYICQGNENYALIALRTYGGDGYARALEQYNREFPGAADNVRAMPAQLSPGTKLWLPSVNYLRDRYGQLVSNTAPPATTLIPSAPPLGSQIGIGQPKPAAPPTAGFPPIQPTQPNQGAANAATFRVPMGGLYIAQIADQQLGNPQRWIEIYRLNPALDPTQPIREGTEIRIPAR